jgi:hypothetical protein
VGIYNASGKLLVEVKPGPVDQEETRNTIALRGDRLLVLTKTRRLEIYNSHSGALVRRWPVPRGAAYLDVFAGVAVYGTGPRPGPSYKMHVLRLTTGKDVVLGKVSGNDTSNIQLEAPGLVYVQNSSTLVFVPLRRVLAAVSSGHATLGKGGSREKPFERERGQRGSRGEWEQVHRGGDSLELGAVVTYLDVAGRADHPAAASSSA